MSGHSKWAQIKRQKQASDIKRGVLFTKLGNAIAMAVRQDGKDPESNFKLRLAIDKAKMANMPNVNIEKAIKRGAGELEGVKIEEAVYEGYGPEGMALIIEALTDNKNRTTANIRHLLEKYRGSLGNANCVRWMFDRKGVIRIPPEGNKNEEIELKAIDAEAEDVQEEENYLVVYTDPNKLASVKENLEKENIKIEYAEIELVPQNKIKIKNLSLKEKIEKFLQELEESEEVNNFYTNYDEG